MNLKILSPVNSGFGIYQPGEFATLPNVDALALVRCGAAEPADRRARRLVEEANAAEKAALAEAELNWARDNPDQRPRDKGGFVQALQARAANWHASTSR